MRWAFGLLIGLLLRLAGAGAVLALILAALVITPKPALPPQAPPGAEDAVRLRDLVRRLRAATEGGGEVLTVEEADLAGALAVSARMVPGLRARVRIRRKAARIALSLPVPAPWGGRLGWVDIRAAVPPSAGGLHPGPVRIGRITISGPQAAVLAAGLVDALAGARGTGARALGAVGSIALEQRRAQVALSLDAEARRALAGRLKGRLRAAVFESGPAAIRAHLRGMERRAAAPGFRAHRLDLHLAGLLREAARRARAGAAPEAEIEAALLALGLACGTHRLDRMLGTGLGGRGIEQSCRGAALGGRGDLRRHFAVSAALGAAAEGGVAFTIGEVKELLDSRARSGFSFDDLMADRAGLRFARLAMAGGPGDWLRLADRLAAGAPLLPDHRDLPAGLDEASFRAAYGNLDDPRYRRALAEIDRRLDRIFPEEGE